MLILIIPSSHWRSRHSHKHTHSHKRTHRLSLSLTHTETHKHTHSQTHKNTKSHTHTHARAHTHTNSTLNSHAPLRRCCLRIQLKMQFLMDPKPLDRYTTPQQNETADLRSTSNSSIQAAPPTRLTPSDLHRLRRKPDARRRPRSQLAAPTPTIISCKPVGKPRVPASPRRVGPGLEEDAA